MQRIPLVQDRVQDRPIVWWTFAVLIVAGQVADTLTTLAGLHIGGIEGNRFARHLMETGAEPLLAACKLTLALAFAWVLVAFAAHPIARRSAGGAIVLLMGALFGVGWWLVIGWNLAVWLVMAHALPWLR